jgi:hypothetical protein
MLAMKGRLSTHYPDIGVVGMLVGMAAGAASATREPSDPMNWNV